MELLLFIAVLCSIGILAVYFGYDSRAEPYSAEHQFARYGMVWDVCNAQLEDLRREARIWRLARQVPASPPGIRVRRRLATNLRDLARRLSPEVEPVASYMWAPGSTEPWPSSTSTLRN